LAVIANKKSPTVTLGATSANWTAIGHLRKNLLTKENILNSPLMPLLVLAAALPLVAAAPPFVGEKAPDFVLSTPEGKSVRLSQLVSKGPVVLVVLRGYPGYQCPYCNRQVQDFIQKSQGFADAGAHVVLVYPGPPQDLGARANEFLADKKLPTNFDLLVDPGYTFTNLYGLRWNAAQETAYPSTFLIDRQGVVFFSKIVKEHGGRTTAAEILDAMPKPVK
jgi:peroxiredoxin